MKLELDIHKTLRSGARSFELAVRANCSAQRIVIYGPSGAGKSLTLMAIAGLLTPESGHIRLDGQTLFDANTNMSARERRIAYLFQDYALFPHLTVRQNIAFGLSQGWRNPAQTVRSSAVDYWLEAFELAPMAQQKPHQLSGGQKQRTALARALVTEPRALLLDEPFAAIDPALRTQLRRELDQLQQRLQVPMILITHDPEDVAQFGEQVLALRAGRVVET